MHDDQNKINDNQVILPDNSRYYYSIKPVEINNILRTGVIALMEYSVIGEADKNFILYRTTDGNWYDIPGIRMPVEYPVLAFIKLAIDLKDRNTMK